MIAINDVLAHIAEVSYRYSNSAPDSISQDFWLNYPYRLRVSITSDIEQSELDHLNRFGRNETVYFSLSDYQHGQLLAEELYNTLRNNPPEIAPYKEGKFNENERLYLFVYVDTYQQDPRLSKYQTSQ